MALLTKLVLLSRCKEVVFDGGQRQDFTFTSRTHDEPIHAELFPC